MAAPFTMQLRKYSCVHLQHHWSPLAYVTRSACAFADALRRRQVFTARKAEKRKLCVSVCVCVFPPIVRTFLVARTFAPVLTKLSLKTEYTDLNYHHDHNFC